MPNLILLGTLLLFSTNCLTEPQIPSILVQSGSSPSPVLSLSINTKKCVHTLSDHFLSITLEPSTIFSALQSNLGSALINMAKGLHPAYIRISGPECNYFKFQGTHDTSQSSFIDPIKQKRNNITITGWHWSQLNEFIAKTGLDLIVGLNVMSRQHGSWDLSNTLDLISYSDKRGYNMEFQIGNDIQTIGSRIDGASLGRDASRLRKVLEAFPRYMNSAIISPDIKSCDTQEEARYMKNFIVESGSVLSALVYQVPFSSEKSVENPTEMFSYIQNQLETRVWQKDVFNKYLGRIAVKKPLWIVESGNKDRRGDFTDGLTWAQRLCAGARVGIDTIMRKPSLISLSEPTPDYWVSILYKALVGSEVLDNKISSGNKTSLETVVHCTKMSPFDPNEGILAPEYRYNRGAVTVFGVNMGSENIKILLKTGQKQSSPLHQYLLTANNRQNGKRAVKSLSTMLNGQKLILSPDGELPIISPKVRGSHQIITIPSQCVFFLVLPDSKSKSCMAIQVEESKESYKMGGKVVDQDEFDEINYETPLLYQEDDLVSNDKNVYVAFRSKYYKTNDESAIQRNPRKGGSKSSEINQQNNDESLNDENLKQSEQIVKYVTFSNNNWLSKFPKTLNNQGYSMGPSTFQSPTEVPIVELQTERSVLPNQSRKEKYQILAQAVAGKRYTEKNVRPDLHPNLDSALASLKPTQKLKLIKRSIENIEYSSKETEEMIEQFSNKDKSLSNSLLKTDESSFSSVPLKTDEDHINVSELLKNRFVTACTEIPEVHQPTDILPTQQTMITSSPATSTTAVKHHTKMESHIQKIKSRAEQALAKLNEKTSKKINGRRMQHQFKEPVNPTVEEPITEKLLTTYCVTEDVTDKKESATMTSETDVTDKLRYNRQTNNATTDSSLKTVRPRMYLKSKNSAKNIDVPDNGKTVSSPAPEITHFEPSTTEMVSTKNIKSRNISKSLKLTKPKLMSQIREVKNEKSHAREIRETTQHPTPKIKIKPVLRPLKSVKTPHHVDADQIVTNEKITEKLFENIKDGKKTLKSAQIVSPIIDNNKENKQLETKTSLITDPKIKALEAKIKTRRSEIERRLQEKIHKMKKRSPTNDMIDYNDGSNDILNKYGSNEIDVDILPTLKRETIRYPRSVADFTVKLNEVNTYVDKNKKAVNPIMNEILEDTDEVVSLKDWKNSNDIRISAEDTGLDNFNIKLKRKSIFEGLDEDDYGKITSDMIIKLFSHAQTFWKYIKKTFHF